MTGDPQYQQLSEQFVQLLTAEQLALHRYLVTLLGDHDAASNVLQETNLVLWRKMADFQEGTSFSAWARKTAYWQALAFIRDRKRDRHVFSEELVGQLSARANEQADIGETRVALRHCLASLSARNLELVRQRYGEDLSISALATRLEKKPSAVKVALMRIRRSLMQCIQKQLAAN
ncbi:MAG: sigma-70 family RNA polymerase sigma factor [Planctomycetales bacterium]|nr:sigma-70 family RNA polymerase sigma factor [Planctomycetales bacterium]